MNMKKHTIFLTLLFAFLAIAPVFAQDLNKYKYVIVHKKFPSPELDRVTQNTFNDFYVATENEIARRFSNMGFTVLTSTKDIGDEYRYLLYIAWGWGIPRTGDIWICGSNVFGQSCIFDLYGNLYDSYSKEKLIRETVGNAFKELENYDYHFQPWTIIKDQPNLSISSWSEDSIRSYLSLTKISPIEGIYRNYGKNSDISKIAVIKENGSYYGIALFNDWYTKMGDVIFELNHIEGGIYDVLVYYSYKTHVLYGYTFINDEHENVLASYEGRLLSIARDSDESERYVKIFPASKNETTNIVENTGVLAMGSGIMIADGIIVTNNHVIDGAKKIEIILTKKGERMTYGARVLCADKTNDLALLSIKDDKYKGFTPPSFRITPNVMDVGTPVFTMGYPMTNVLGEEIKVTDGIISSKSGYEGDIVTYQISAPIQPGNSGGALFDKNGNLIGITNAGVQSAENVGYAIKSSYLLNLIDSAPITIKVQIGKDNTAKELSELIKTLTPYVAYIKVY